MFNNQNVSRQKRTACDRCRAHKLRCVRDPTSNFNKCTRCARAGVSCVIGPAMRFGRPTRRLASTTAHRDWMDPAGSMQNSYRALLDAENNNSNTSSLDDDDILAVDQDLMSTYLAGYSAPTTTRNSTPLPYQTSHSETGGEPCTMADGHFDLGFSFDGSKSWNHALFEGWDEELAGETKPTSPPARSTSTIAAGQTVISEAHQQGQQTATDDEKTQKMIALSALISSLTGQLNDVLEGQRSATHFAFRNVQEFLSILEDLPSTVWREDGLIPGSSEEPPNPHDSNNNMSSTPDTALTLLIISCYTIIVHILRNACDSLLQMQADDHSCELQGILGLSTPVDNPGLQAALMMQMILYFLSRAESFLGKSHGDRFSAKTAVSVLVRKTMRLGDMERDVAALREDMEKIRKGLGL